MKMLYGYEEDIPLTFPEPIPTLQDQNLVQDPVDRRLRNWLAAFFTRIDSLELLRF